MIKKEYYRIEELEKRFGMSFSDLQYLVENSQIDLVFLIERNKFIIGGWREGKGFVGYSSVLYQGLVTINQAEQLSVLSKKKVACKTFTLLTKDNIKQHNLDYPFETQTPNSFLHDWTPKVTNDIEWETIPAKLFPQEKEHSVRAISSMFRNTLSNMNIELPEASQEEKEVMAKIPKVQFYAEGINFSLDDVCILHSDLVRIDVIEEQAVIESSEVIKEEASTLNTPKIRTDDFQDLLIDAVKAKPEYSAKHYWELFKQEVEELEGFRTLDKYNLLVDVTGSQLKWQPRTGETIRTINFNSFPNRVTKARKAISTTEDN